MECRQCGSEVKGKFCHKCGAKVGPSAADSQELETMLDELAAASSVIAEEPAAKPVAEQTAEPLVKPNIAPTAEQAEEQFIVTAEEPAAVPVAEPNTGSTTVKAAELDESAKTARQANMEAARPGTAGSRLKAFISLGAAAILASLLMVGVAFGMDWLVDRGQFAADLSYHLMKNALHIPVEQAAYFADQMSQGIWLQMLLLQGGTIAGEYTAYSQGLTGETVSFSVHIPFVFNALLGLAVIFIAVRALRAYINRHIHSDIQRLLWVIGFSVVFSVILTIVSALISQRLQFVFGERLYDLELGIVIWKHALTVFLGGLLASAAGIGGWRLFAFQGWVNWARSMRSFMIIVVSLGLLISGLMLVNWSVAGKHKLHSTEIITLGAVWDAYKTDSSFYAVMPNVLVQEFVYSIGGAWQATGQQNADWLGLKAPVQLQMLTGIKELSESGDRMVESGADRLKKLESEIRFKWFHAAFMLAFLYALSRIRFSNLLNYIASIIGVIGLTAVVAMYFNIRIQYGEAESALVGFQPLQALLAISIFVGVSLTVSYGIQYLWAARGRLDASA